MAFSLWYKQIRKHMFVLRFDLTTMTVTQIERNYCKVVASKYINLLIRKTFYMFHFIYRFMSARTTRQIRQSPDPGRSDTVEIPPFIEKTQLELIYYCRLCMSTCQYMSTCLYMSTCKLTCQHFRFHVIIDTSEN